MSGFALLNRRPARALVAGLLLAAAAAVPAAAVAAPAPPAAAIAPSVAPAGPPAAAEAGAPVWIFFRDRAGPGSNPAPAGDVVATDGPTARALTRRARATRERAARGEALHLDPDADRGVSATYVAAVEAAGAVIRTRSRWLNAVSADADSTAVAAIQALPFVTDIRPVRSYESASADAVDEPGEARSFDFGRAARQLDMLHVPEAHAMGYHGHGVLIAVLDTGFNLEHEAFGALEVRGQWDFINGDDDPSYDPRTDFLSQADHGTQVLSILAGYEPGRLIGPAFAADFLLARTEQPAFERPIEEDWWVAALEWAERRGADIVSSSLSYTKFYGWRDMDGRHGVATRAANLAFERGLIVVESVGNQGPREGRLGSPADALGAISVGAVDENGRIAAFSTRGPTWDLRVKPDVAAMGVQVEHAVSRTRDRYGRGNGTSYATPLVAGCIALILEAHPDWGPEAVREALAMSASRAASPDNRYGWGIVNVRDAILYPQIEGRVADAATHEPVEGALVTWEPAAGADSIGVSSLGVGSLGAAPSDSAPRGAVSTDSTGAYVIPNLPRGTYRLRIAADGYRGSVSEPIQVPPGLGDVNFELRYRGG